MKAVFCDYTTKSVFIDGKKVADVKNNAFSFVYQDVQFVGEIKTLGNRMKKQMGFKVDENKTLKEVFKGIVKDVPDMTLGAMVRNVRSLVNTPAKNWKESDWKLYELYSIYLTNEKAQKNALVPNYVETNAYENFDCPLTYNGKTVQPFSITSGYCAFGNKEDIVIAWEVDIEKKPHLPPVEKVDRIMKKRGEIR